MLKYSVFGGVFFQSDRPVEHHLQQKKEMVTIDTQTSSADQLGGGGWWVGQGFPLLVQTYQIPKENLAKNTPGTPFP